MVLDSTPRDPTPASVGPGPHSCSACGHAAPRWFGRCPECGAWGSARPGNNGSKNSPSTAVVSLEAAGGDPQRLTSGIDEVDRVLGGGLVPGSVVLLAGEPGIGKSTLVLQLAHWLGGSGRSCVIVTGEESVRQVAIRAERLALPLPSLRVAATTSLAEALAVCEGERPDVLILDSIQTMRDGEIEGGAGAVVQVRECAAALVRHAKGTGRAIVLTGHVTKDGSVAGPKVLEHVVDTVLMLEGERGSNVRLVRATKNRFGSCDETGVFEMGPQGLTAVPDPSAMLLADRHPGVAGSVVFPSLDGSRPVLVELQALVVRGPYSQARRVAIGLDPRRLNLILGVLDQCSEVKFAPFDIFASTAGGLAVREPGADLALCVALHSAHQKLPLDPRLAAVGEVGLGGEVRRVPGLARRFAECARLGYRTVIGPREAAEVQAGVRVLGVSHIREALELLPPDLPEGGAGPSRATLG